MLIFLVLLIPLPFMLFGAAKGACESVFGWRKATPLRHAGDVGQCICFAFLLPYLIRVVIPAQETLVALNLTCGDKARQSALDACDAALNAVTTPHLVLVVLNVLLLACDVMKYNGNAGEKAKSA